MDKVWRIRWTDPSGNSGHGEWQNFSGCLDAVLTAYRAEVPGRVVVLESRDVR